MPIEHATLRENLLERQIDAVRDSIGRSRTTWTIATLFTFVIAAAVFNGTLSYNDDQISRRATVLGAVSRNYDGLQAEVAEAERLAAKVKSNVTPADLTNQQRDELALATALSGGVGQLGYLSKLMPATKAEEDKLKALRALARFELQAHVTRRVAFDTVQIPLIGLSVTGSDLGIVGGIALIIIGYWLLAALRGEWHAFGEFVSKKSSGEYTTDGSPYTREESAYAFNAIRHYMIFTVSTRESWINFTTRLAFLAPCLLVLYNHWTTVRTLVFSSRPELGAYLQPHVLWEGAIVVGVVLVWLKALSYQLRTVRALQAWRELVEMYAIPSGPRRRLRIR